MELHLQKSQFKINRVEKAKQSYLSFLQLAKSASLQPTGFGMEAGTATKKSSKDTLSTCDSSSEVSDEGYKSSQVISKMAKTYQSGPKWSKMVQNGIKRSKMV